MLSVSLMVRGRLVSFKSEFSDDTIQKQLCNSMERGEVKGDFANKMCTVVRPSSNQLDWMHFLVFQGAHEAEEAKKPPIILYHILSMMLKAGAELKYPKMRLNDPDMDLKLTGSQSRHPGTVSILAMNRNAKTERFIGRINASAQLEQRSDMSQAHVSLLRLVNCDPKMYAVKYGKTTGNCCFCGKELTHPDSLEVGYGPICAGRFGLPHGGSGIVAPNV